MSAPAKFLFDVDFSGPPKPKTVEATLTLSAHQAAVADAEARAYASGVNSGKTEAEQKGVSALASLSIQMERLRGELAALERRLEAEAVEVALAIARKLCPELMAQEPLAEVSAMVSECFSHLVGAPHAVVRVAESLQETVRERIEDIARRQGFDSRLVVLGERGLRVGDCRIEWADGGVSRDQTAVETNIAEAVSRYIRARGQHPSGQQE